LEAKMSYKNTLTYKHSKLFKAIYLINSSTLIVIGALSSAFQITKRVTKQGPHPQFRT